MTRCEILNPVVSVRFTWKTRIFAKENYQQNWFLPGESDRYKTRQVVIILVRWVAIQPELVRCVATHRTHIIPAVICRITPRKIQTQSESPDRPICTHQNQIIENPFRTIRGQKIFKRTSKNFTDNLESRWNLNLRFVNFSCCVQISLEVNTNRCALKWFLFISPSGMKLHCEIDTNHEIGYPKRFVTWNKRSLVKIAFIIARKEIM